MNRTEILPAATDTRIHEIATLAEEIWHEHFTPIIGEAQVDYMVEKFQSFPAIKSQIEHDGYEYYQIRHDGSLAGYMGIHAEEASLFLSKLYIQKSFRGRHLATEALEFLKNICHKRNLDNIWLTCNKHNDNTLAIYDHLGFKTIDATVSDIGNGFVMDDYILSLDITLSR